MNDAFTAWIATTLGHAPRDIGLFQRALTHGSHGAASYERLEFLGDRVLGLIAAAWLYERFPDEPEGSLSRRINSIVSRETCAEVGRALGVPGWLRLGADDRDLLADERVDEGGLARIGGADDGDKATAFRAGAFRDAPFGMRGGHDSFSRRALAAAVSASCLDVPSALASAPDRPGRLTTTVKRGAWCGPERAAIV